MCACKRLLALLDRLGGRKLPVAVHSVGGSNTHVAMSLGRVIRERGLDTIAGRTQIARCWSETSADCLALKREGLPIEAKLDGGKVECQLACLLILAGGVNRTLPAQAVVVLAGTQIHNRLAPNVSQQHQEGLQAHYHDQYRRYLADMGVSGEIVDIIEHNTQSKSATVLNPGDWLRLRIVTAAPQW
jgi:hypothetical protein